jgi:protein-S-isoprenylcysteine O-methyltransferase Ste14
MIMGTDVRAPMGAMFTLLGLVLSIFGLVSDRTIYQRSLGINVNLWWGLVILAFGLLMLLLAWTSRGTPPPFRDESRTTSA